jgi:hypothetical protein
MCNQRKMAFSFTTVSRPGGREDLIKACVQYNPGRTTIRKEFMRLKNGNVVYTVDVCEVTKYGEELHRWLQDGKRYDKMRKKNPDFPSALTGPMWCLNDVDGNMDPRYDSWWLYLTTPLPRHS